MRGGTIPVHTAVPGAVLRPSSEREPTLRASSDRSSADVAVTDPKKALADVFWIGGPPDSGKTTVADLVGGRCGVSVYHLDRQEVDHIRRSDARLHPATYALRGLLAEPVDAPLLEETWVSSSPEKMAERAMASWSDRMPLVIEDLLALPDGTPIIAEGPGFLPSALRP